MKKLIAMFVVFGLAALITAYIAMAPFASGPGSPLAVLDAAAAQAIAVNGRSAAVLASLGIGLVLSLLAGLAVRDDARASSSRRPAPRGVFVPDPDEDDLETLPPAEPSPPARAPLSPEARLAAMRQRAQAVPEAPRPDPRPAKGAPAPVVLVRKAREPDRDWFDDTCWLGGLPCLGPAPWPRDEAGGALPFVAQIDLARLAAASPEAPLPKAGALAFFLDGTSGAVVPVSAGAHEFSQPPADLAPAFDEDGAPFPPRLSRLSRMFFPFWPVEPLAVALPDEVRAARDSAALAAADQAIEARVEREVPPRDHPYFAQGLGAPVERLWWFAVFHLADAFGVALDNAARPIALRRDAVSRARIALTELKSAPAVDPGDVAEAEEDLAALEGELAQLEAQRASLPEMIAALEGFMDGHQAWEPLSEDELDVLRDLLPEAHERYGELIRDHVAGSLGQLASLCQRTMVTGAPDALAALPEDALWRINREYRLPPDGRHQMFGPQAGSDNASGRDLMLLQLAWDDMMEWRWGQQGVFRFWIGAADAAEENWAAARVTFEDA